MQSHYENKLITYKCKNNTLLKYDFKIKTKQITP